MLTLVAILVFMSVPYALDVYFNSSRDSESTKEEQTKVETCE